MNGSSDHPAILMGDLVRSGRHAAPDTLHVLFNHAVETARQRFADLLPSPLTITLGDEFQGIAVGLAPAFEIASAIRLDLLAEGVECRFVVGVADLRTPINPDRAWNMMGPGLTRARKLLNEKQADQTYRFSIPNQPMVARLLDGIGLALGLIERDWTPTQRADTIRLLSGLSAEDLAGERGVSLRNIYKIRRAAHYDLYTSMRATLHDALATLDSGADFR